MSNSPEPLDTSPPPQFGLRALFILVTAVCVLLAVLRLLSPLVMGIVVLLIITVGAHLAASGIGHRLSHQAQRKRGRVLGNHRSVDRLEAFELKSADFAPTTRLGQRRSLGRIMIIAPVLGGVVGTTLGGFGMAWFLAAKATAANVSVAAIAAGVLGAIGSFLLATFLKALVEAVRQEEREE